MDNSSPFYQQEKLKRAHALANNLELNKSKFIRKRVNRSFPTVDRKDLKQSPPAVWRIFSHHFAAFGEFESKTIFIGFMNAIRMIARTATKAIARYPSL